MILRTWHGRAAAAQADAYRAHFRERVAPELAGVPGFLGAHLGARQLEGEIEFVVTTRWSDQDAIEAFAGEDRERAVVEPEAAAVLLSFERTVTHFEVLEEL